ncbi:MAG: hypothetical protein S4CHLAM7_11880 [Chlamydiae bacterium]|nr:hypothetical protein [Chlamydiota bacterium]
MKKILTLLLCIYSCFAFANLADQHTQALLVLADHMNSTTGKMWLFEKEASWKQQGSPIEVSLGRGGLAWSHGLHGTCPTNEKPRCEGSLTAPLGIYSIDAVFELNPLTSPESYNLPYIYFGPTIFAVDDVNSKYYNMIVDANKVEKDWSSAEDVSLITPYRYGAVVGFNQEPVDREAGSAIFLHVWRAPGHPTAGCTAMSEKNMSYVAHWLKKEAKPVLIQLTKNDYLKLKDKWKLPDVPFD